MLRQTEQRAEQVVSGFKSPADDYLEGRLNIADAIVVDPHCTFYFQMDTNAMQGYGLKAGDILVIDKSLKPVHGAIVIANISGIFYCCCYVNEGGKPRLQSDDNTMNTTDGEVLQVWGVVTSICRNTLPQTLRRGKYSRVCTL